MSATDYTFTRDGSPVRVLHVNGKPAKVRGIRETSPIYDALRRETEFAAVRIDTMTPDERERLFGIES